MRVTNKMLSDNYLNDMRTNLNNMQTLQQQLSTGKNFTKPSDDPFNVARTMQMQTAINVNTQYNKNITDAGRWLDTTDTALGQLGNVFQTIREKLVSAGNAAYGSDEREKIKDVINQSISQVSTILNTNFGGEYIFGGTKGDTKPTNAVQDYVVNKSDSVGGDISIKGTPDSSIAENTNYRITVTGIDTNGNVTGAKCETTTDGKTWTEKSPAPTVTSNSFTVDGLNMKIDPNLNTAANDTYTFSLTKNTKLIYTDDDGNELKNLPEVVSKVVDPTQWSGKTISFNVNGAASDESINLDTFTPPTSTIDDVVSNINTKIKGNTSLSGKVMAEKTSDGEVKLLTLTNDIVNIKSMPPDTTLEKKQIPNIQMDAINSKRKTEISQGVLSEYNASAVDVVKYGSSEKDDIRNLLSRIVNNLDGKDDTGVINADTATKILTNDDLTDVDNAVKQILKVRSQVGSKGNAMDSAEKQNEQGNADMTKILSKTEDIDITQKVMEFATMQTVYMAALQTSSKVLQPTLMDYLR